MNQNISKNLTQPSYSSQPKYNSIAPRQIAPPLPPGPPPSRPYIAQDVPSKPSFSPTPSQYKAFMPSPTSSKILTSSDIPKLPSSSVNQNFNIDYVKMIELGIVIIFIISLIVYFYSEYELRILRNNKTFYDKESIKKWIYIQYIATVILIITIIIIISIIQISFYSKLRIPSSA